MSSVFEGSEKKVEVTVTPETKSLRSWSQDKWYDVVRSAGAQILSAIKGPSCDAYLLSESSLFVWDHRFTMITCGTTTLVGAVQAALEKIGTDNMECLIYQRKNEYFPQLQHTDFFDDIKVLQKLSPGRAYRLGNADEHHTFLFHSDKDYRPYTSDSTLEILMYDLQGKAKEIFCQEDQNTEVIRSEIGLDRIFPEFEVDDHAFYPYGYSLNALRGNNYYTIHVTPQEETPYVSFETNFVKKNKVSQAIESVVQMFEPRSFDIVYFDSETQDHLFEIPGYQRRSLVRDEFKMGYTVQFGHFSLPQYNEHKAHRIQIESI